MDHPIFETWFDGNFVPQACEEFARKAYVVS
jgi:hypothetical protein